MENQKQQTVLLGDGLIAQQAAITTIEKANAPKEQGPGNVSDFKKLNPVMFAGTEKPLEAEH